MCRVILLSRLAPSCEASQVTSHDQGSSCHHPAEHRTGVYSATYGVNYTSVIAPYSQRFPQMSLDFRRSQSYGSTVVNKSGRKVKPSGIGSPTRGLPLTHSAC